MPMFDPASPDAARWRASMVESLRRHGMPPNTRMELRLSAIADAPAARMRLDAWWEAEGAERHARSEALVPLRRLTSRGWPGWPAYVVLIRLMRSLG